MHWYRYSLYQGRNSRNILPLDAHFLNSCVTSCWWHILWCRITVLNAGGFFCGPGTLKNGKQKAWHQHHYLCIPKRTLEHLRSADIGLCALPIKEIEATVWPITFIRLGCLLSFCASISSSALSRTAELILFEYLISSYQLFYEMTYFSYF